MLGNSQFSEQSEKRDITIIQRVNDERSPQLSYNNSINPDLISSPPMSLNPGGSSGIPSSFPVQVQQKILYGEHRPITSNRIVGAHSPQIKTNPSFRVRIISNNPDGTTFVELIKQFPDGTFSRAKRSTLAPDSWSDNKIIDTTNQVANTPAVLPPRSSDGATLHRQTVDGVEWEVIKDASGNVTSSYPTGGRPTLNF